MVRARTRQFLLLLAEPRHPMSCLDCLLTDDAFGFILDSFSKEPLLPPRVIADCLLVINVVVGRLPELDMFVTGRNPQPGAGHTLARKSRTLYVKSTEVSS